MTTTIEILKAARELIAKPENWGKRAFARDASGEVVDATSDEAVCFCTFGALKRVTGGGSYHDAVVLLRMEIPEDFLGVMEFNDSCTHSEVLDLFSKAISSAEEKQGAAS